MKLIDYIDDIKMIRNLKRKIESLEESKETDIKHIDFLLNQFEVTQEFLERNKYKTLNDFPFMINLKIQFYLKENGYKLIDNNMHIGELLEFKKEDK